MANSTVGNLPAQATLLVGGDILPISRDGTNLNKTTLTNLKVFTDNNTFSTIGVSGQTSVVADSSSDTLTLASANANLLITTNPTIDTITFEVTTSGGGTASIPEILTTATVGRTLVFADLQNFLPYNSVSDANFTIPNDTTLGITGANLTKNYSIDLGQVGNGKPTFVAGAGVTLEIWSGYPPSAAKVTQTAHRVATNTWWVK
jgi:hypothetical protein